MSTSKLETWQIEKITGALCAAAVVVASDPRAAAFLATLRAALVSELQEVNRSRNAPEADRSTG